MSDGAPLLAGVGLGCIRGERAVFAGLDVALPAGGALVLHGPNGAGKSSLLRILAGLLPPAAGHLAWRGTPLAAAPGEAHAARLHYLGHANALKPDLGVAENLRLWAALRGAPAEAVPPALAAFGLESLAELPARLLSAGQQRRLALARLRTAPAPLWLLDEPGVGLDSAALARLAEVIAAHRATGGAVALATHQPLDLADAAHLALDAFAPAPEALPLPEIAW
mgnify:CR=1 FL=1